MTDVTDDRGARAEHVDSPSRAGGQCSDYAILSREVRRAGLLNRRPRHYAAKIEVNLLLLAAGWTEFALIGRSWWQLLVAVFLAVMFTQVAFVGHDAGHQQISASKRVNDLPGQHGVAYHETGIINAYAQVLRHLHAVGGPLRPELEF